MTAVRRAIGRHIRRWADRIDYYGAPKSTGLAFTFERGRGLVINETGNRVNPGPQGCLLWYLGDDDYERAHTDAVDPVPRVDWERLCRGKESN